MIFPQFHIDEVKKQTDRDLTRFDLDFDLPDHMLPEFPPAIFLTTRPDLGDVSQGKLVTTENFYEMFKEILNPKQLEGLRLLVTPFPQQQFNATDDRRSRRPSLGVSCFDCHVNGHTNGAAHLAGDIRPQEFRHRIETPSLRGRQHPAPVRLAARAQERRRLHRVRAARRLLRRRPHRRDQEGRQHPGTRQPGPLHGGVPGAAGLSARAQARPRRQAGSGRGIGCRDARAGRFLRQGPVLDLSHPALLHRQSDAQPEDRAVLREAHDRRAHDGRRRRHQDVSAPRESRTRRPISTTGA